MDMTIVISLLGLIFGIRFAIAAAVDFVYQRNDFRQSALYCLGGMVGASMWADSLWGHILYEDVLSSLWIESVAGVFAAVVLILVYIVLAALAKWIKDSLLAYQAIDLTRDH